MLEALARIEQRSREGAAAGLAVQQQMVDEVVRIRVDLAGRDTELRRAFTHVVEVCGAVNRRLDADRAQQRELTQTLGGLRRCLSRLEAPMPAPSAGGTTERLVGGSVFGTSRLVPGKPIVDLAAAEATDEDAVVEVRCRFGGRWVDGFEVCDMIDEGGQPRYRLRRQSDGSVLPRSFGADELRVRDAWPR